MEIRISDLGFRIFKKRKAKGEKRKKDLSVSAVKHGPGGAGPYSQNNHFIQANAFLYHMVRNIVGSLLPIGDGRRSPNWMAELLTARDRALAAATAPAQGLYLVSVNYPPCYNLHPSSQSNKDTI